MRNRVWYCVPVLLVLAHAVRDVSRVFTARDVSAWCAGQPFDLPVGIVELTLVRLRTWGYVTRDPVNIHGARRMQEARWCLTAAGMEACRATVLASKGPEDSLTTRLWNLLRIRKRLTSDEAAQTLIDAGEQFEGQRKQIGATLAAWAHLAPDAVTRGAKREPGGFVRYVLVQDLGRHPPPSRPGQLHPSKFEMPEIPARYRRASTR